MFRSDVIRENMDFDRKTGTCLMLLNMQHLPSGVFFFFQMSLVGNLAIR